MIEKIIGPVIEVLSNLAPGWKTTIVGSMAGGMALCEMSNMFWQYGHSFDAATWGMLPLAGGVTIAIRKYREMKDELTSMKEQS